jgi:dihydrofolate reductase
MSKLKCNLTISLDGYLAGPDQSLEEPLGIGGKQLHQWAFANAAFRSMHGMEGGETNASTQVVEEILGGVGAVIMGRNMFGGGRGPWTGDWRGWWGDNPPYHAPVFVLTHHPRERLDMQGGTSFTFVTGGIGVALEQARAVAGDKDISIAGGAHTFQQFAAAKLIDEINVSIVPVILGGGERLFERIPPEVKLEQTRSIPAPGVTHVRYRVVR